MKSQKNPYFQNQSFFSLRCGLHAVNNFLGKRIYTEKQFDTICQTLEAASQQKYQHFMGGDYDVSVLIQALHNKGYEIQWHDSRKQFSKYFDTIQEDKKLQGYLVNMKLPQKFYHKIIGISGRHWVSIRLTKNQKGETIFKLDSKDKNATPMNQDELLNYLEDERKNGAQILKVFSKAQEKDKMRRD